MAQHATPKLKPTPVSYDKPKLKQLILYIAHKSETWPEFGDVHMNKALFHSEFRAFARLGRAISGQKFQAIQFGPASKMLLPVRREMQASGLVASGIKDYHGQPQTRTYALQEPDLTAFTAPELEILHEVLGELHGRSATEISLDSHDYEAWRMVGQGREIPYGMALCGKRKPLTLSEIEHGRALEVA